MKRKAAIAYALVCALLVFERAAGYVDWPWAAVLAPIWVPALVAVSLAFIVLVLAVMLGMIGGDF